MNRKHAYLIKAHHQFEVLKKLLMLLDDERNDIYIHIGLDVEFHAEELQAVVHKSDLYFVERIHEQWGGYSQIQSELILFREAWKRGYEYYHLLSGADLPLKTQDEIHAFFSEHKGKEFLYFCPKSFWEESRYKYEQYYWLQERIGREGHTFLRLVEKCSLFLQRRLGVKRQKSGVEYCLGANWVSITHNLVAYILQNEELIKELFHATLCGDEFFVQTLVWNSKYREQVFSLEDDYYASLRYIDWKRGNPYVWRSQDYAELMKSPYLFARKFEEKVDSEIIDQIFDSIMNKQKKGIGYEK